MADRSRIFYLDLPEDEDTIVYGSYTGLSVLNLAFDKMDSELFTATSIAPSPIAIGKWNLDTSSTLASSATLADNTYTWILDYNLAGRGSFTQSGSFFQITTAGYYRITFSMQFGGGSTPAEGYITAGIKQTGSASFVPRTAKQSPIETYAGNTALTKSVVVKADTGADLALNTNYQLAAIQENSGAVALTPQSYNTWFVLEYIRTV